MRRFCRFLAHPYFTRHEVTELSSTNVAVASRQSSTKRSLVRGLRLAWVLSAVLLLLSASLAPAQDGDTPIAAPQNPEFLTYLQREAAGIVLSTTDDGYGLGVMPPPVDLSHMAGQRLALFRGMVGFPTSYDLRAVTGKLSPIRNQGACGSCWAFATYGSLESWLRPTEQNDFSEMDPNCHHGFDWTPCSGANEFVSTAYLGRWDGPVNETCYPYNPPNCTNPRPSCAVQKHVQEVIFPPARGSSLDNDNIKQMVTTYGAMYTSFYWDAAYYNSGACAYYYSGSATSNHAVCIVGWDDNYSKYNFSATPAGNGAFIMRNSWGTGWGQSGYFYMSYYDSKVGVDNAMFSNAEETSNYNRRYDYDPLGWVSSVGYGSTTAWFANIFTAATTESLAAASFYTASPNSSYEMYIYLGPTTGPRTGTLAATKTGAISYPGYKTIVLDSPVSLTAAQKFSVVVKLTTPGYTYPIPYEYPVAGYSSLATAGAGQSYISSAGSSWQDITTWTANSNVCLKAFTVPRPPTNPSASPVNICPGGSSMLAAAPGAGGDTIAWYSGSCGGAFVGTGTPLSVSPISTTTYYAKTKNSTTGCLSPSCASGVTVTVDMTPPSQPTIDSVTPQYTNATDVSVAFSGSQGGDFNRYEGQVDSGGYTTWASPHTITVSGLTEGQHTVDVRSVDNCGNPSSPAGSTFTIDNNSPVIQSVVVAPPMAADGDAVHVVVVVTDNVGVTSVTANGATLADSGGNTWSGDIPANPTPGLHTVTVVASDAAGNTANDTSQSYKTAAAVAAIRNDHLANLNASWPLLANCLFLTWGRVTRIDADTFEMNDGSGPIRVSATGHGLLTGDYACARGIWDFALTLSSSAAHVRKLE